MKIINICVGNEFFYCVLAHLCIIHEIMAMMTTVTRRIFSKKLHINLKAINFGSSHKLILSAIFRVYELRVELGKLKIFKTDKKWTFFIFILYE